MFSKLIKLIFVSTSLSPILLTLSFLSYHRHRAIEQALIFLGVALLLLFVCLGIICLAKKKLAVIPLPIIEIRNADAEILGFFLAYLIPFMGCSAIRYDLFNVIFIFAILGIVLWNSNHFHFNPLLGIFGFHFYEVKNSSNVTYILITKKTLLTTQSFQVVQLANYLYLEK